MERVLFMHQREGFIRHYRCIPILHTRRKQKFVIDAKNFLKISGENRIFQAQYFFSRPHVTS